MYVKVENNEITSFVGRPDWRDNDGNAVEDSVLIAEGYFPIDYETNKPDTDSFYQQAKVSGGFEGWEIQSDKVVAAYILSEKTLTEKQADIKAVSKTNFASAKEAGFLSPTLGVKIDSSKDDLDNMSRLLSYMELNSIDTVTFRVYDNSFVEVTSVQLEAMINELIAYGIEMYAAKWSKEVLIEAATMEELQELDLSFETSE